jgi:hypothetical protein
MASIASYPYHHEGTPEPTPGRVARLRARALRLERPHRATRQIPIRAYANGREIAHRVPEDDELVGAFHRLVAELAPGKSLDGPWSDGINAYNVDRFHDLAFVSEDDDGVLVSVHCVFPRDGCDLMVHAVITEDAVVRTRLALDSTQNALDVEIGAGSTDALDAVTRACDKVLGSLAVDVAGST